MRVELKDGQWAEVNLSIKRKAIKQLLLEMPTDGEISDMERGLLVRDAALALCIPEWSLDLPVPLEDASSIDEIDIGDFNTLAAAAAPVIDNLFGVGETKNPMPGTPPTPSAP